MPIRRSKRILLAVLFLSITPTLFPENGTMVIFPSFDYSKSAVYTILGSFRQETITGKCYFLEHGTLGTNENYFLYYGLTFPPSRTLSWEGKLALADPVSLDKLNTAINLGFTFSAGPLWGYNSPDLLIAFGMGAAANFGLTTVSYAKYLGTLIFNYGLNCPVFLKIPLFDNYSLILMGEAGVTITGNIIDILAGPYVFYYECGIGIGYSIGGSNQIGFWLGKKAPQE